MSQPITGMAEAVLRLASKIQEIQNRATIHDEKGVKRVVKRVLKKAGAEHFLPSANAFGKSGVSDFVAVKNGLVAFVETKYGNNKPTTLQLKFGKDMTVNGGALFSVVNEKNLPEQMARVLIYFDTGVDIEAVRNNTE